jgi:hypothetical protein
MTPAPSSDCTSEPEAVILPEMTALADALRELVVILQGLKAALDRKPPIERLALRIDEVAAAIGMSRRAIERERSAGRWPLADLQIGKAPLWRVETIRDYLSSGKEGIR